jgi:GGDEF domain-containing protein
MTGLETRQAWQGGVKVEVERLQEPDAQGSIAVLLIDVDHFKEINDRKGHGTGDGVLGAMGSILEHVPDAPGDITEDRISDFARRLAEATRGNDTIAHEKLYEVPFGHSRGSRFGGDEFALMIHLREPSEEQTVELPIIDALPVEKEDTYRGRHQERRDPYATYEDQVEGAIDRIKDVFDSFVDQHPDLDIPGLGISVGAAIWRPGMNSHELLDAADKSMYETKQNQFFAYFNQLTSESQAAWREAYQLLEENGGFIARMPKLPPTEAV